MNDFFTASASDEAYRSNVRAAHSYRPSHSRSRSAHSHTSQHSSAEDMAAQIAMPAQDPAAIGLQPPNFPQTQSSKSNNLYQDTQTVQPSFSSSGNTMSPSISSYHEHATPETFLSDQGYTDISQYTTPGFEEDLLDAQMNMNFLTVDAISNFNNYSNTSMLSHNSSGPSSVNASNNNLLAPDFSTTYMSPSLTTHSSPGSSNECLANPSLISAPSQNSGAASRPFSPGMDTDHPHGMSLPEQQRSPALTGSPGDGFLGVPQDRPANFTSPVVRIENFSRDESPARTDVGRNNRSLGNKRSGNHLSPHDAEDESEDEQGQSFVQEVPIRTVQVAAPLRGEDGSWVRNANSGHVGISPEERKDMHDYIPTLKEQEDQRLMEEKNIEVAEWLTRSEVGSEAGSHRRKSESEIGSVWQVSGISKHVGPDADAVTPANEVDTTNPSPRGAEGSGDEEDADFEDGGQDGVIMELKVRSDPIIPTVDGFRAHARLLNPRLDEYMIERIAQEQTRRYKKLLDLKVKHLKAIKEKNCGAKGYCIALGGQSKILPPRTNNKEGEASFAGFQIVVSSEDEIDPSEEGTIIPKPLPPGFPIPPVKRMPAEFECPLCFKVKKFYKPSDWTKHVYEDLQPFTCTFPNCGEPMSFKRKADWVRHENERHRQLEKWVCNRQNCGHTCYRKDNFVQHLVREHKVPEPKARTGRAAQAANNIQISLHAWQMGEEVFSGPGDISDKVWALVEACRQDTTKQPKNEPCRFCGNICASWKKLTVHLAKHLEQISLPILPLVESKPLNADSIISPVEKPQTHRPRATSSAAPSNSSKYHQNLSVNSSYSSYNQDAPSSATSNIMHTYPPPQFQSFRPQAQPQPQAANYGGDMTSGFAVRSYPGLQGQSRLDPNQYASNGYTPSITPPVTDYAQSGQVFHSPVEAGPFGSDLPTNLYAYNGPIGPEFSGGMAVTGNMQHDPVEGGGQYRTGQYPLPSSYPRAQQQQGYPYQG
ncbi:Zinc finger C2H2-type protein [Neofusicoccum parvum]|nr:Zinc finger C2H2-type protein [Neofusicoccum parvum]